MTFLTFWEVKKVDSCGRETLLGTKSTYNIKHVYVYVSYMYQVCKYDMPKGLLWTYNYVPKSPKSAVLEVGPNGSKNELNKCGYAPWLTSLSYMWRPFSISQCISGWQNILFLFISSFVISRGVGSFDIPWCSGSRNGGALFKVVLFWPWWRNVCQG